MQMWEVFQAAIDLERRSSKRTVSTPQSKPSKVKNA